jgi:hypothetical protein
MAYPAPKPSAKTTTKAIIKSTLDNALEPPAVSPYFFGGCGPIALFGGQTTLDHGPSRERVGVSMWNERKMPERWYGLLRERMQVEEQRMRVIKDGDIIEHDDMEELMAEADSLDREMLLVLRQAIAAALVREAA